MSKFRVGQKVILVGGQTDHCRGRNSAGTGEIIQIMAMGKNNDCLCTNFKDDHGGWFYGFDEIRPLEDGMVVFVKACLGHD